MLKRYLLEPLRGTIATIALFINTVLISLFVIISAPFVWMVPWKPWRHYGKRWMFLFPMLWAYVNYGILLLSTCGKWRTHGNDMLSRKHWYLLISNHQSYTDILILTAFFRNKLPILKFFMKQELLWSLPLAGLASYLLGYPFMKRVSHQDIRKNPALKDHDVNQARKACKKFAAFPTTVINFVEGTRFTTEKHQRQRSPYQHLLKPKAGGIALVIEEMHEQLTGIVDATIQYQPQQASLWDILCGRIDTIDIHYRLLPIQPDLVGNYYKDRSFRRHFQQWLNDVWEDKDKCWKQS